MPARRLRIGVTGHRPGRLADADIGALRDGIAALLSRIADVAKAEMQIVSALAEGADSIVADEALARGWPLDVVLPFARADYAGDFEPGEARHGHDARLSRAHAVFELPGDRSEETVAYERAGRIVLAQSDILIAVWDGEPARGRGGAAQVVAEAVLQGIPVVCVDPVAPTAPTLLWDGLEEVDLGQQTVETVARADLTGLAGLTGDLIDPPDAVSERAMLAAFGTTPPRRAAVGLAYPLLLAVMGVRRLRWTDAGGRAAGGGLDVESAPACLADRVGDLLAPRFAQADSAATRLAQRFRSGYVANFALAAAAVVLSLLGLALAAAVKPVLIALELAAIATILLTTRIGNRAGWHRRWLDNRALAERLRCLALSLQLGDLDLRADLGEEPGWVGWYTRATARELGLTTAHVDAEYMGCVRNGLLALIDGQIAYLKAEARRMHVLEHRLHLLGTVLFGATAATCLFVLLFKASSAAMPGLDTLGHPLAVAATIASAALPAIGAAIYGIRMQGDFAGIAGRDEALAHQLSALRVVIDADTLSFDTLARRVRRATDLLTKDLASWVQTYRARPLALPG